MAIKARKPDRTLLTFGIAFVFIMMGWYFHTDAWHSGHDTIAAYSLSLGDTCEADVKTCKIVANPPIGYRTELSRNEVVSMDFANGADIEIYRGCLIWDVYNWECENGKIAMRYGVIAQNGFEQKHDDLHYVPRIAWKMAKLHILPLDSVRDTPPPKPARRA